ncbi:hypothetical protein ACSFBL_05245 [Variovorax sp. GT1P44]
MICEAIHCPDTATVRFAIYPDGFDGPRIMARIADDALDEVFGAGNDETGLLDACEANFQAIESKALERYRASPYLPVTLAAADFEPIIYLDEISCGPQGRAPQEGIAQGGV